MRGDPSARMRRIVAPGVIAAVLLAALSEGCRTAGAGGKVDPDPAWTAVVRPVEAAEIAALPDGPGKALVTERCLLCHGAGLLAQQRKDAAAWGRQVRRRCGLGNAHTGRRSGRAHRVSRRPFRSGQRATLTVRRRRSLSALNVIRYSASTRRIGDILADRHDDRRGLQPRSMTDAGLRAGIEEPPVHRQSGAALAQPLTISARFSTGASGLAATVNVSAEVPALARSRIHARSDRSSSPPVKPAVSMLNRAGCSHERASAPPRAPHQTRECAPASSGRMTCAR